MKWPWVSRARYDLLEHNFGEARRSNTALAEAVAREQQRAEGAERQAITWEVSARQWERLCDELRALLSDVQVKYHELRMTGAQSPVLPRLEAKEADPMVLLINSRTVGRPAMRGLMLQQLKRDRDAGKKDDQIQKEIEAGESLDGIPA